MDYSRFLGYAAIAVAAALVPVAIWELSEILLLAFGAILLASLLRLAAEPLQLWTPLPDWAALTIAAIALLGLVGVAGWVFGSHLASELKDVLGEARTGAEDLRQRLSNGPIGGYVLSSLKGGFSISGVLESVMTVSVGAIEALVVIVISAAYLAADPDLYADGAVKLFPRAWRPWARETMDDIARALRYWLLGQLLEMIVIGVLTAIAAYLIPLPSPIGLGLIAGVAEFVPYVGPIIAAIPALLIALTKNMHVVIWTAVAYLLIHQVEGNLLAPMIQRRMTFVPPALLLIGIAALSSLAGLIGLVFGAPMVVCGYVLVQKIYLRDVLHEPTKIVGEEAPARPG